MIEEWKWETPVFAAKGNVVAVAAFKDHVKLNFSRAQRWPIRAASSMPA